MTRRHISIDLLNLMVESQVEAGADKNDIWRLIYAFTPNDPQATQNEATLARLSVDNIPAVYRGDFLTKLLALPSPPRPPDPQPALEIRPRSGGKSSSVRLWQKATTALRLMPRNSAG